MLTVVALTPSLDLTYLLDELRPGEIHRTADVLRIAGGKALNMARAAKAVGASCRVVALVGGGTGREVADLLAAENLSARVTWAAAPTRICVGLASAASGELTEAYEEARPVTAAEIATFQAAVAEELEGRPGWLSISGRAPLNWPHTIADLVRLGHRHGLRVALDTHGPALAAAAPCAPDLVKVNRMEAAELLGSAEDAELTRLARDLHERTGGLAVVTDGVHGAAAAHGGSVSGGSVSGGSVSGGSVSGDSGLGGSGFGGSVLRVPGLAERGAFPVGSGDSYLGGLLAALDAGAGLVDAIALATGCATANALVPGPGRFEPATARRLAGTVRTVSEAAS